MLQHKVCFRLFGIDTRAQKPALQEIGIVDTNSSREFTDFRFAIVKESVVNNSRIYIVKGLYNGTTVGLKIQVQNNMKAGLAKDKGGILQPIKIEKNAVTFSSIGKESNDFITAMANLYNLPRPHAFAKKIISAACFSLNAATADLTNKSAAYYFKLFFPTNSNYGDAELYFNIDLATQTITLSEKDPDYRDDILKTFGQ